MEMLINQTSKGDGSPNVVNISLPGKNPEKELKTIMELICLISKESESYIDDGYNSRDVESKIEGRFKECSTILKNEFTKLTLLYSGKINTAKKELGMTDIRSEKVALYLRYQSNIFLEKAEMNPVDALNGLTGFFREALVEMSKKNGNDGDFELMAIRYYLYDELIKCNIFPNPEEL